MRISDWSSDVCSSDLRTQQRREDGKGGNDRQDHEGDDGSLVAEQPAGGVLPQAAPIELLDAEQAVAARRRVYHQLHLNLASTTAWSTSTARLSSMISRSKQRRVGNE